MITKHVMKHCIKIFSYSHTNFRVLLHKIKTKLCVLLFPTVYNSDWKILMDIFFKSKRFCFYIVRLSI